MLVILKNKIIGLRYFLQGLILQNSIVWGLVNRSAIKDFESNGIRLSTREIDFVKKLNLNGFVVTDVNDYGDNILKRINTYVSKLDSSNSEIKSFLKYKLGGDYGNSRQKFDSLNPLLEIALNKNLTKIIDSYFEMSSKLCYLEVNETVLPDSAGSRLELEKSQKFHKDPGIEKCIKVFLYLTDVDENSGPFTYVKGSHKKFNEYFPQKYFGAGGLYPDPNLFDRIIDKELITPICGKAGTLILADTTGLHCGGNSLTSVREMATMVYYPPGDIRKSKIDINFKGLGDILPASNNLLNITK